MADPDEQRAPADPERRIFARKCVQFGRFFSHYFHRLSVLTPPPPEAVGPAIIASNHINYLDPVLIQSALPRLASWMMAKEYYDVPGLRWMFGQIDAIPVDRKNRDLAATRSALRVLEAGRTLGVFPEGRIGAANEVLPFQAGVGLLAIKSGVPVIPVYIEGSHRGHELIESLFSPRTAVVRFGQAMHFDASRSSASRPDPADVAARIRERVIDLMHRPGDVAEAHRSSRTELPPR